MTMTEQPALAPKGRAAPLVKTPQQKALAKRQEAAAEKQSLEKANAQRLAQIVNLHIAGYSLSQIGNAIGASAEDVDRMLQQDASRYVRSQPALRVYVRNWISERYTKMLDAVWEEATDKTHRDKLENQDRALRILDRMERLHGASAPTQTEVKVEAAPEAVERLVQALSQQQGMGYDVNIFDVIDGEVVHEAALEAHSRTEVSGNRVAESDGDDDL